MNQTYTLEQIEAELIYLNSLSAIKQRFIQPNMFETGLQNYTKVVLKKYKLNIDYDGVTFN